MSPLFTTEYFGRYDTLIIAPPQPGTGVLRILNPEHAGQVLAILDRADVERLRELCDEALS